MAVERRVRPARVVVGVDATCTRYEVVETVRRVRRRAARVIGTHTARLPRGAAWRTDHPSDPVADGPAVRLHQPSHLGDQLTITVQIPWTATGVAPPRSMVRFLEPEIELAVVAVGPLRALVLPDVVAAHRVLDGVGTTDAPRWQLYDADLTRLWVAAESPGSATPSG